MLLRCKFDQPKATTVQTLLILLTKDTDLLISSDVILRCRPSNSRNSVIDVVIACGRNQPRSPTPGA